PVPTELPESVRLAVRAANRALGRTTWRADLALLGLLDEFRSLETVPALIAQLEYFFAHLDEVKSGKLSGLAVYQAHELLVSMTGAVFPADQPEKWRAFWEAEKDKIAVTEKRNPAAAGAPTTVAGGFCGIPVQGTRVVFVVDLSGSMDWPMADDGPDGKKKKMIRLDFAKRELKRAMDLISPNAQFNLITFNGNPKAESWKPAMVQATPANREAFKKYVDGLRADGGTNVWSGLEDALKIKSVVFGNRYTTNIDELFVLSDGAPTVGDVQDPVEILRLVQECNKFANVRINTIFISSETPEEYRNREPKMKITPQELMRRMAQENGGKFREL
ncbi:MAG: VWA domain-containing protein, partial [Planctomycetota bacterium]